MGRPGGPAGLVAPLASEPYRSALPIPPYLRSLGIVSYNICYHFHGSGACLRRQVPGDPGHIGSSGTARETGDKMSGSADAVAATTGRTKDGIPTWGGEASSFVQYEEAALLWEQSLTWEKRYTAGPKLVQELTGAARRLVSGQPAGWVAFRGGVTTLMDHLRLALGKPRVNEVTDLLATYFKGTRRKPQETMNDYITRKTEAYMRASQALRRVQPHYERGGARPAGEDRPWQRRLSDDYSSRTWSRQWTQEENPHEDDAATATEAEATTETTTTRASTEPDRQLTQWNTGWSSWQWGNHWRPVGKPMGKPVGKPVGAIILEQNIHRIYVV